MQMVTRDFDNKLLSSSSQQRKAESRVVELEQRLSIASSELSQLKSYAQELKGRQGEMEGKMSLVSQTHALMQG